MDYASRKEQVTVGTAICKSEIWKSEQMNNYTYIYCFYTKTRLTMLCLRGFIVHSKYFPDSDWLKVQA